MTTLRGPALALTLSLSLGAQGGKPVSPKVNPPRKALAATLGALKRIQREDDFELPPEAVRLLNRLRDQLHGLLETELGKASVEASGDELTAMLQGAVGKVQNPNQEAPLGVTPVICARRPAGHPNLLMVTAEYPTRCGRSTSLYVFRTDGKTWRMSWSLEPGNDLETRPGFENLEYVISEAREGGTFYLTVSHNPPWCTSCWSVLRVTSTWFHADGTSLGPVLDREFGFYRCDEKNLPHLVPGKAGVALRYQAMSSDSGLWGRQVSVFFSFAGNRARMEPLPGLLPDETMDLWKRLEPEEAAQWSEPTAWPTLKVLHETLHKADIEAFVFVRPGKEGTHRILVAFETRAHSAKEGAPLWYATLVQRDGIYRVEAVSQVRPDGFAGEGPVRLEPPAEETEETEEP